MQSEREFRVIGPPGTGKTTYLSHQVARAVEAGHRPLITSLTRAAAAEISSRVVNSWNFSEDQVGTLHSHCFRALRNPELISKPEHVRDWNEYAAKLDPTWELSVDAFVSRRSDGDEESGSGAGNKIYETYNIYRAQMTPEENWPITVRAFARKFREWRSLAHLVDFTDLIELSLKERVPCPFSPDVIFVDEAQDHDRLELSLLRQWAEETDQLVVCGDPDQNLYEFRGSEPEAFYATKIPDKNYIVLSQSYRVPRAVHACAMRMINRINDRWAWDYHPRDESGSVKLSSGKLSSSFDVAEEIKAVADSGRTVMVLATCEYMLAKILKYFRDAGIPWHNPYALNRTVFNPLGVRRGVASHQRFLGFLRAFELVFGSEARRWTWQEFEWWVDAIKTDGFIRRGAKKKLEEIASKRGMSQIDMASVGELLEPVTGVEEMRACFERPLAWFRSRLNASRMKAMEFPLTVVEKGPGVRGLIDPPKIVVGTIHSVKGGEADVVYLFPDLSPNGLVTYQRNPAEIYRAFYVGITRAKQELHLCRNSSKSAIIWGE